VTARPAVFLDRDGTVVVEREYLADPERVELVDGAAEAIQRFRASGYAIVMVTNQSGIARGLFGEGDFWRVQAELERQLAVQGAGLDAVYYCPHHPDHTGPCNCRKPGTALFERAAAELGLDLRGSYFIGDRLRDVTPARVLGGKGILVRTGYGESEAIEAPADVYVVRDLGAAAVLVAEITAVAAQG